MLAGSGAGSFSARVAGTAGGTIELHIDSCNGVLAGTCAVASTGSATSWNTVSCPVSGLSGRHMLYLKFKGTGTGNLFNLNWWVASPGVGILAPEGAMNAYGKAITVMTGADKMPALRMHFAQTAVTARVKVLLLDLEGRQVAALFDGRLSSRNLTLPIKGTEIRKGAYIVRVFLNNAEPFAKTIIL